MSYFISVLIKITFLTEKRKAVEAVHKTVCIILFFKLKNC